MNQIILSFLFLSFSIFANPKSISEIIREVKPTDKEILYLGKTISNEEFIEAKKKELIAVEKLYKEYFAGISFQYHSTKYFNVAHACSKSDSQTLIGKMMIFFQDTYPKYFSEEPKFTIRVVLFKNKTVFKKTMGFDSYGAYYPEEKNWTPTSKTFFSYCGSGPGTAWHEMIHGFVDFNTTWGDYHQWFNEGFASFYEMGSTYNGKFIEGYTNWRHPELRDVLNSKKLVPLKTFLMREEMKEDYGYAYGRFIFCYLWMKNKMIPFVKSYLFDLTKNYKGKELGEKVILKLEELLEKKIDLIQIDIEKEILKYKSTEKLIQVR
jgi:hypothetical protein